MCTSMLIEEVLYHVIQEADFSLCSDIMTELDKLETFQPDSKTVER